MTNTQHDLEHFAARVRSHFELELRDAAFKLALDIAHCVGARAKLLRPDRGADYLS